VAASGNTCTFASINVPGTILLTATVRYALAGDDVAMTLGRAGATDLDTQTATVDPASSMSGVAALTAVDTVAGARTYGVSRSGGTGTIESCRLTYISFE
jgi:hypothetical protein